MSIWLVQLQNRVATLLQKSLMRLAPSEDPGFYPDLSIKKDRQLTKFWNVRESGVYLGECPIKGTDELGKTSFKKVFKIQLKY